MTNGEFSAASQDIIFSLFVLDLLLVWSHMVGSAGGVETCERKGGGGT